MRSLLTALKVLDFQYLFNLDQTAFLVESLSKQMGTIPIEKKRDFKIPPNPTIKFKRIEIAIRSIDSLRLVLKYIQ
jgi:hypothetical protein